MFGEDEGMHLATRASIKSDIGIEDFKFTHMPVSV
jgi:hypothetical protein